MTLHASCGYFLIVLATILPVLAYSADSFDKKNSELLTSGKKSDYHTPRFQRDFSLLSETSELLTEDGMRIEAVYLEKFWYSELWAQVLRYRENRETWAWLYINKLEETCLYKERAGQCEVEADTCRTRASEFVDANGDLDIKNHLSVLQYPVHFKEAANLGTSSVRGIQSNRVATRAYDDSSQTTTVSEWHTMNPTDYKQMNSVSAKLLMAHHKKYKNGTEISDKRVDYTDYRQLSITDAPNGLQIGETRCAHIDGEFQVAKQPPNPSVRHGFISEFDEAGAGEVKSSLQLYSYTEYNYYSQIYLRMSSFPTPDENEVEVRVEVIDFATNHGFHYSITNGNCKYLPQVDLKGYKTMPLPQEFWSLTETPSYLGVYMNRDIPCNTWLYEFPDGAPDLSPGSTITLFLATSNWLKEQGQPEDMFYPVQKITRSDEGNEFESIFEFKDNPGYHIPELFSCFDRDDIVTGKVTLEKTNYYRFIAHREIHFQYEFRTFIQNITGIKSHMRVAKIVATPSRTNPDETDVKFSVLGKFAGANKTNSIADLTDPVTSQEAAEKINTAVDKGDAKFHVDATSVTLHLKKGSFRVLKNDDHYEYVDNPSQDRVSSGSRGYSSVVMAASGLTLFIVCLALSVLAVIVYKRWTEGQDILPSFTLQNLSNDSS